MKKKNVIPPEGSAAEGAPSFPRHSNRDRVRL